MVKTLILVGIVGLAACDVRTGRWDGSWTGQTKDGAFVSVNLEQSSKESSGNGIAGDGTMTWKAADGMHSDPITVSGYGERPSNMHLRLSRDISHPSTVDLGSLTFVAGATDPDGDSVIGTLDGDDHYGLHIEQATLVLTEAGAN